MAVEFVLNDLSVTPGVPDRHSARRLMVQLVDTVASAARLGASRVIHCTVDPHSLFLAADYPIAAWRNDAEVDIEGRRYFSSLVAKAPLVDEAWDELGQEYLFAGQPAAALGFAYVRDDLAVSLAVEPFHPNAQLELVELSLDGLGDAIEQAVLVRHASAVEHVQSHVQWIEDQRLTPTSGSELWRLRLDLYPSLHLLERLEDDLVPIVGGNPHLAHIHRRLTQLDAYVAAWTSGPFRPSEIPIPVSPDSQHTLDRYGAERTFLCPDGVARLFTWHIRLAPQAWRMYVHFDATTHSCFVGYVGPHLRTARFR